MARPSPEPSAARRFLRALVLSGAVHASLFAVLGGGVRWFARPPVPSLASARHVRTAPGPRPAPFAERPAEALEAPSPDAKPDEPAEPKASEPLPEWEPPRLRDPFATLSPLASLEAQPWLRREPPAPASRARAELGPEATAEPLAIEPRARVHEAVLLSAPRPTYPWASVRRGEAGTVLCRLHVAEDGSVTLVQVLVSSGHQRLDRAAVEALRGWRFRPRREDERAVPTTFVHEVEFRLPSG